MSLFLYLVLHSKIFFFYKSDIFNNDNINHFKNIITKNYILNLAEVVKDLNIKRNNKNKLRRIDIIIDWLKNLESFPSLEDKLNVFNLIKKT